MLCKSILLLAFAFICTRADDNQLFEPCNKNDLQCMDKATTSFLGKTYGGVPDFGLQPIDPLFLSSVEVIADDKMGLVFHFKNVTITGFKNMKLIAYNMDTDKKTVMLKFKIDMAFSSDFKVGLTKLNKQFEGQYSASANSVYSIVQYTYNLKVIKGVEHFEVGPETITCEVDNVPTVTLSDDLTNVLSSDDHATSLRPEWETKKSAIRKTSVCEVVKAGLVVIVHNIRASARVLPKNAFFKDI